MGILRKGERNPQALEVFGLFRKDQGLSQILEFCFSGDQIKSLSGIHIFLKRGLD